MKRLRRASIQVQQIETQVFELEDQLDKAIGARRQLNRITVPSELYNNDKAIEENLKYIEGDHDSSRCALRTGPQQVLGPVSSTFINGE